MSEVQTEWGKGQGNWFGSCAVTGRSVGEPDIASRRWTWKEDTFEQYSRSTATKVYKLSR